MSEAVLRIAVTAIVINSEGKVLITKRSKDKKRWPGRWTVPGGTLDENDYNHRPADTSAGQWYGVIEDCLRREVEEETGLRIRNIKYECSLVFPGTLVLSFSCNVLGSEEVKLQESECEAFAWVTKKEAESYDLIEGILEEIQAV